MTVLPAFGLHDAALRRAAVGRPVRVALIGCGKFGTMFLAQARRIRGLHIVAAVDLDLDKARAAFARAGWAAEALVASTPAAAVKEGTTFLTRSLNDLLDVAEIEVVVEATGDPRAGTRHALEAIGASKHVVLVTVEADVLVGFELAQQAAARGVVYSMAYGDQPSLICELVDWARSCGFNVVCAGKGTKYLPSYHAVTPDEIWQHYGFAPEEVASGDYNAKMFTSFLDGTKSAIEMAAVANATGLLPPEEGLSFPPAGVDEIAEVCRPQEHGGSLSRHPTVEVISSLRRDGAPVERHLRWGVYVTFTADDDYTRRCLAEYGGLLDAEGRYGVLYRPNHYIGLELPISVLSVALHRRSTGATRVQHADVVAVAKRHLAAGSELDGEGGYCAWGRVVPIATSVDTGALPMGLADGRRLVRDVTAGETLRWTDVEEPDVGDELVSLRRRIERALA